MECWYSVMLWGILVVSTCAYKIIDSRIGIEHTGLKDDILFVKNDRGLWKISVDEQQKAHTELFINSTVLAYDIDQLNRRIIWLDENCNFNFQNICGETFANKKINYSYTHETCRDRNVQFIYEPFTDKYYIDERARSIHLLDLKFHDIKDFESNELNHKKLIKIQVDSKSGYLFFGLENGYGQRPIYRMDTDLNKAGISEIKHLYNDWFVTADRHGDWSIIPERKEIVVIGVNGRLTFLDYMGKIKKEIASERFPLEYSPSLGFSSNVSFTISGNLNTIYWFIKKKNGSERLFSLRHYEECNDCQPKLIELDVSMSQASDMKVLRSKPFNLTQKLCENPKICGSKQICTIRPGGSQTCICKERYKTPNIDDPKTCSYFGSFRFKRQGGDYPYDLYHPQPTMRPDPSPQNTQGGLPPLYILYPSIGKK